MGSTCTRKVFQIGDSRAITIPQDVKHHNEKCVHLIYNDQVIVVFHEHIAHIIRFPLNKIIQNQISQALRNLADSMTEEANHERTK